MLTDRNVSIDLIGEDFVCPLDICSSIFISTTMFDVLRDELLIAHCSVGVSLKNEMSENWNA